MNTRHHFLRTLTALITLLMMGLVASLPTYAQGSFSGKNLGGQPILQNGSPLPKATGKIEILDGSTVLASGFLVKDGYFALGTINDTVALGDSALLTIRAWDTSVAATYDQAMLVGRGYGYTSVRIKLATGNNAPFSLVDAGFPGFELQPYFRLTGQYTNGDIIYIVREDIPYGSILTNAQTWLIIHGWRSSRSSTNIHDLTKAVISSRPHDQIITLDWSSVSDTSLDHPEQAAAYIVSVADWAAQAMKAYGINATNLNIIGHSFGAYVSDEIAKRFPQKVNSLVALDPAADCCSSVFDPVSNDEIDFRRDSVWSWAFHASSLGNEYTPPRATESFIIDTGLTSWDAHSNVVELFAHMLAYPNNLIDGLFSLSNLIDDQWGPWALDQYTAYFLFDKPATGYEAIIYDPSGAPFPSSIKYIPNKPSLTSKVENRSVLSPIAYLSGQVSDLTNGGNQVSVLINGDKPQQISSDGASGFIWQTGYYLNPGTNIFNVVATDDSPAKASTTNTLSVVYIIDTTKPIALMAVTTNASIAKNISIQLEAPYGSTLKLSQSIDLNHWSVLGTVQTRTPSAANITNGTAFVKLPIDQNPSLMFKADYVQ